MLHVLLSLVVLAAPADKDKAGQQPAAERGPPPIIGVAELVGEGNPVVQHVLTRYVWQARQEAVKVGDRVAQVTRRVAVPVQQSYYISLNSTDVQVLRSDGKRVAPAEVARFIKGKTLVLLSADGKQVDPFYLRVVRDETLMVLLPPGQATLFAPPRLVVPEKIPPPREAK